MIRMGMSEQEVVVEPVFSKQPVTQPANAGAGIGMSDEQLELTLKDASESLLSFQKLLNTCVACHQSFRTR